jgi:predicted helicase
MSAIQQIYSDTRKQNEAQGEEMVQKVFNDIVLKHILKHFYGFELLIAPYAIAHLKLTLEVERLGFDFALTRDDGDKDNDRFKIYLANTLDDPNSKPSQGRATSDFATIAFPAIPQESESAREVKNNVPILAILGNPPYSMSSQNMGDWIKSLTEDYKKGLDEKNVSPLSDDYIKFIRFAQWKITITGQGIIAMITSNTFIDGTIHRQMRRSLMDTFDEIYIYNLHGNSRKGETVPGGGKDENVFNIQQGVSIIIFVKYPEKRNKTIVKRYDLLGLRENKFAALLDVNFELTKWRELFPQNPMWSFVDRDEKIEGEFKEYENIEFAFLDYSTGISTGHDDIAIQFDRHSIEAIEHDFRNLDEQSLKNKYSLIDSSSWKVKLAKSDINKNQGNITKLLYRPFDKRFTYFTGKSAGFIERPRMDTMRHMLKNNLGLVFTRLNRQLGSGYFNITNCIVDRHILDTAKDSMLIAPFYIMSDKLEDKLFGQEGSKPNLSSEFIKACSEKLKLKFVSEGKGDLENTFGPESVFYYAYAVFHSPTYRSRYAEQLKSDFPRLPITSDKRLFATLVGFGNQLASLHLLGENPFDKSKTIFDEPEKWEIRIGGAKPEELEDWKVTEVRYDEKTSRVYVNKGQYFEGIEKEVWNFMIGGYQVCEKWLKDRKKAERSLSTDDLKHYMKIVVSLRETIRIMSEIDKAIPSWPIK